MLSDPIYVGYYVWNKWHFGKFHRYAQGQTVLELKYNKKGSKNDKTDWVQSRRLFEPLVDRKTWDAVQRKLEQRSKRTNAPRSATQYLAGLVCCGNCGSRMVVGPTRTTTRSRSTGTAKHGDGFAGDRYEYFCGSYFKAVREGRRQECSCLRNGVFQDTLEFYVERYLEQTGQRLALLTEGLDASDLTNRLESQEEEHWWEFMLGMERLKIYLMRHRADEYHAIVQDSCAEDATPHEFVEECVECYRASFDPSRLTAEIEKLEAEHTALMKQWADLPTPLAKEKAKEQFAALEARIEALQRQQEDVGEVVATHYQEMLDLEQAIADAKLAMRSEVEERALRQRAEALRAVIQRIECTFTATGETGGGWGKKNARLAKVTIYPVGDSPEFSATSKGTLMYSSAHSIM